MLIRNADPTIKTLRDQASDLDAYIEDYINDVNELVKTLQSDLDKARREIDDLEAKNMDLESELITAQLDIQELEEKLDNKTS